MLKVFAVIEADKDTILIEFKGGITRLFAKENFIETIKEEAFYENNKGIIHLGYHCCTR